MENVIDKVMKADLMISILENLSDKERKEFDEWVRVALQPLEGLTHVINDMASTEESAERLAEVVHQVLSPQGFEEVKKWLGKS